FYLQSYANKYFSKLINKIEPQIAHQPISSNLSNIINYNHIATISSWIDNHHSTYNISEIPYRFRLLYRGSRYGFSCASFHRLCDNLLGTVVVIKIVSTNEILGGYNPLAWSSANPIKWSRTDDSFIFSLKPTTILSRAISADSAIGSFVENGPIFGYNFFMTNNNGTWHYNGTAACYEKQLRGTNGDIMIDEVEVFQV
ncbi:4822_t:CDS:2, partial [Dentiscutata heterogama]